MKVAITGYSKGLNKVQLNQLLRVSTGCSLSEAKSTVDTILSGTPVVIAVSDVCSFCESAAELGAVCSPVDEQSSNVRSGSKCQEPHSAD